MLVGGVRDVLGFEGDAVVLAVHAVGGTDVGAAEDVVRGDLGTGLSSRDVQRATTAGIDEGNGGKEGAVVCVGMVEDEGVVAPAAG